MSELRKRFPNAKTDIAKTCITYLSFDAFEAGFCSTDEEFETRLHSNPLYDYAARNWGHHIRKAPDAYDPTLEFLKSEAKVSASSQAMELCPSSLRLDHSLLQRR